MTDVLVKLASLSVPTSLTEADVDDLRWLERRPFGEVSTSRAEPTTNADSPTESAPMEAFDGDDPFEGILADPSPPTEDVEHYSSILDRNLTVLALSRLASRVLGYYYGKNGGTLAVLWRFTVAGAPLSRQKPPKPASSDRPPGRREIKRQARVAAANGQAEALLAYAHLLWNLSGMRVPPFGFAPGDKLYGGRIEPRWYGLPSARQRVGLTRPGAKRLKTTLRRVEREKGVKLIHERPTKTGKVRTVVCEWALWKLFSEAFMREREEFAERAAGLEALIERKATIAVAPCVASRPGPAPSTGPRVKRAPRRRKARRGPLRPPEGVAWPELGADDWGHATEEDADVA